MDSIKQRFNSIARDVDTRDLQINLSYQTPDFYQMIAEDDIHYLELVRAKEETRSLKAQLAKILEKKS